jgi:hypothetical protein
VDDSVGPLRIQLADDELAQRRQRLATDDGEPRWLAERDRHGLRAVPEPAEAPRPLAPDQTDEEVRQAETSLAAAQALHWQCERDLADAEALAEAARERVTWLEGQYLQARRDRVSADQDLAEARSLQRAAVQTIAEAHRRLDAAEAQQGSCERPPP